MTCEGCPGHAAAFAPCCGSEDSARAHVAATVHTLVLAYAGAAQPMLMLFAMYASALGDIWNREMIVVEVVRALAGSIGLAAAMPLTTLLAALTCRPALRGHQAGGVGGAAPHREEETSHPELT